MPVLNFDMDSQLMSFWCWAAVANGVTHFYNPGSSLTQCEIANMVLNKTSCCPHQDACNEPEDLKIALSKTQNFVDKKKKLSWKKLENELSSNRVVAARIELVSGAGHFVVIYGTTKTRGVKYVSFNDPKMGVGISVLTLSEFRDDYLADEGDPGRWTDTYLTK